MAGVNLNFELFDLTARRRKQELLKQLEALNQAAFGTQEAGPPTRFGEVSISGGQLPQNPFVQQLLTNPQTADVGIKETMKLLEQQRQAQLAQNELAQQQGILADISQQNPKLATLAKFAGTPGFGQVGIPSLAKQLTSGLPGAETIDPVQSSSILPDGTVQLVRKSGAVEITTPSDANVQKIKSAQEYGALLGRLKESQRGAGAESIKASVEAFKGLQPIRQNIANIDEAIGLLDQGAQTGVIQSRLPSIRDASIKLDNLQGRLGLDVLHSTTFGALSANELKFALSTALPKNLSPLALKQWLVEKRSAQDKLASYLESAAIYLGTPGNTIADFIQGKKTQQFYNTNPTTPLPPPDMQSTPPLPPGFVIEGQ